MVRLRCSPLLSGLCIIVSWISVSGASPKASTIAGHLCDLRKDTVQKKPESPTQFFKCEPKHLDNGTEIYFPVGEWKVHDCESKDVDECMSEEKIAMKKAALSKVDKPLADSIDYDYYDSLRNTFNFVPSQADKQCREPDKATGSWSNVRLVQYSEMICSDATELVPPCLTQLHVCVSVSSPPSPGASCCLSQSTQLEADPTNIRFYLQCNPSQEGADSGVWIRMECPVGTSFNSVQQACGQGIVRSPLTVVANNSGVVTSTADFPTCPDGKKTNLLCNEEYCPKDYECVNRGCCPVQGKSSFAVEASFCFGNKRPLNNPPRCSEDWQCPFDAYCQTVDFVCCPKFLLADAFSFKPEIEKSKCSDGRLPLDSQPSCSATKPCPLGFACTDDHVCCRNPLIRMCANGDPPKNVCNSQHPCPSGSHCTAENICCSMDQIRSDDSGTALDLCPDGYRLSVSRLKCSLTDSCPTGLTCSSKNVCCEKSTRNLTTSARVSPKCPDGTTPLQFPQTCSSRVLCPANYKCTLEQMCCKSNDISLANEFVCPDGVTTSERKCKFNTDCSDKQVCIDGHCCKYSLDSRPQLLGNLTIRRCPDGSLPLTSPNGCRSDNNCPSDFICLHRQCCGTKVCPGGFKPLQNPTQCSLGVQCPAGYICASNNACCPTDATRTCPDKSIPLSFPDVCLTNSDCPVGFACTPNHVCCETRLCPDGNEALTDPKSCNLTSPCPNHYQCSRTFLCCPIIVPTSLTCPDGSAPLAVPARCGLDVSEICPTNFFCDSRTSACCKRINSKPVLHISDSVLQQQQQQQQQQIVSSGYGATSPPFNFGTTLPTSYVTQSVVSQQPVTQPYVTQSVVSQQPITQPPYIATTPTTRFSQAPKFCPDGANPLSGPQDCSAGYSCPNGYYCFNGACCPQKTCSDGSQPSSTPPSCVSSSNCSSGFLCTSGVCCKDRSCPDGSLALPVPNDCSRASCPEGFSCSGNNFCCRQRTCADGSSPLPNPSNCDTQNGCPSGYVCQNTICCKNNAQRRQCPAGLPSSDGSTCSGYSGCGQGYSCVNSVCCPSVPLVSSTCPDGSQSQSQCQSSTQCPSGLTCQNSLCCKSNFVETLCPDGRPSVQTCSGYASCPAGYGCQNNVCCTTAAITTQTRRCLNGSPALSDPCTSGQCPAGFQCENGLCCGIRTCPDGNEALSTPSSCSDPTQCPLGYLCVTNLCCRRGAQSVCPGGGTPQTMCSFTLPCPAGFMCLNGVCCPIIIQGLCPDGTLSMALPTRCDFNTPCPGGFSCFNGVCCQQRICADGSEALSSPASCSPAVNCPFGYQCINSVCCRSQSCPDGSQPAQSMPQCGLGGSGRVCPPAYTCSNGLCCLQQAVTQRCPDGSNGLYLATPCSLSSGCPGGYSCLSGACCPSGGGICPQGSIQLQGISCGSNTYGSQCPQGSTCFNGVCCQNQYVLASPAEAFCPDGSPPLSTCKTDEDTCPRSFLCVDGLCCQNIRGVHFDKPNPSMYSQALIDARDTLQERKCYDGSVAIQKCVNGYECPQGYSCVSALCCSGPPKCPNGRIGLLSPNPCKSKAVSASSYNSRNSQLNECPSGYYCEEQLTLCCPLDRQNVKCFDGSLPISDCSPSMPCPLNYMCTADPRGSFCCPFEQVAASKCSDGKLAAAAPHSCASSDQCPPSYGCTVDHVCCPLPITQFVGSTALYYNTGYGLSARPFVTPNNVEPPRQYGVSAGNVEPSKSYGMPNNLEPAKPYGTPANVEPSKAYGTPGNVELSKSYLTSENVEPSKPYSTAGNVEPPVVTNQQGYSAKPFYGSPSYTSNAISATTTGTYPVGRQTCPDGRPALRSCSSENQCPISYICIVNTCCDIPKPSTRVCPNGDLALPEPVVCSSDLNCPFNYQCLSSVCCSKANNVLTLPPPNPNRCPDGSEPLDSPPSCSPDIHCPIGFACSSSLRKCCRFLAGKVTEKVSTTTGIVRTLNYRPPTYSRPPSKRYCPDGNAAYYTCQFDTECSEGYACVRIVEKSYCCQQKTNSVNVRKQYVSYQTGSCPGSFNPAVTITICSSGAQCPTGYFCPYTTGVCCPNVRLCQDGMQPLSTKCAYDRQCPTGYHCQTSVRACCRQLIRNCPDNSPSLQITCLTDGQCPSDFYCPYKTGACCKHSTSNTEEVGRSISVTTRCPGGYLSLNVPCTVNSNCPKEFYCALPMGVCCQNRTRTCPDGNPSLPALCRGDNDCVAGYYCPAVTGACCPGSSSLSQSRIYNASSIVGQKLVAESVLAAPAICPGGTVGVTSCQVDSGCPADHFCLYNICCPIPVAKTCSNGAKPLPRQCPFDGNCGLGLFCDKTLNVCCPSDEQNSLSCPNGVSPFDISCSMDAECPPNLYCAKDLHACCTDTRTSCPDGSRGLSGFCNEQIACPLNFYCSANVCCKKNVPLARLRGQTCPDGTQAVGPCINGQCGTGFTCLNNLCCRSRTCPDGTSALTTACTVDSQCPPSYYCPSTTLFCCLQTTTTTTIQTCADGSTAVGTCINGQCGPGFTCQTNGNLCCVATATLCANGNQPAGACIGGLCGTGFVCDATNNICCTGTGGNPTSRCLDGTTPSGTCVNGLCSTGFTCTTGNLCCATGTVVPTTQCTDGSTPVGACINGLCAVGFTCSPQGFCCTSATTNFICPSNGLASTQTCNPTTLLCATATLICVDGVNCCPQTTANTGACVTAGFVSIGPCINGLCPTNNQCENNNCCGAPTGGRHNPDQEIKCKNGAYMVAACSNGLCGEGYTCEIENNFCCPVAKRKFQYPNVTGTSADFPVAFVHSLQQSTWSNWQSWTACNVDGVQVRQRNCLSLARDVTEDRRTVGCLGDDFESRACDKSIFRSKRSVYQPRPNAGAGIRPGSRCSRYSAPCNGEAQQISACVNGVCTCLPPAIPSGLTCILPARHRIRGPFYAQRSMLLDLMNDDVNGTVIEVETVRNCTQMSDCNSTNEQCINGLCISPKGPGDFCSSKVECTLHCPASDCLENSEGVKVCVCNEKLYKYGRRCMKKCPQGTRSRLEKRDCEETAFSRVLRDSPAFENYLKVNSAC